MVLFYEEKKLKTPTRARKLVSRTIKIVMIFALMVCASLMVLSTIGGKSNALRLGVQDYLTEATGYIAEIGTLQDLSFFPASRLAFDNLIFYRPVAKDSGAETAVPEEPTAGYPAPARMSDVYAKGERTGHIGAITVSMRFWDMFFSRRYFTALDVRDVVLEEGAWLPHALDLKYLRVEQEGEVFYIRGAGVYGGRDFSLSYDVKAYRLPNGTPAYHLHDKSVLTASLGDISFRGGIDDLARKKITLNIDELSTGKQSFKGDIVLHRQLSGLHMSGHVQSEGSVARVDVRFGEKAVSGTITFPTLEIEKIPAARDSYKDIMQALGLEKQHDKVFFGEKEAGLEIAVQSLLLYGKSQGDLAAFLDVSPYKLDVSQLSGTFAGGQVYGDMTIDAAGAEALLDGDVSLKGALYARAGDKNEARADLHVKISSKGTTFKDLYDQISGHGIVLSSGATVSKKDFLYDHPKIMEAFLPRSAAPLAIRCVFGSFTLDEKGVRSDQIVLDIDDTVTTGSIVLPFEEGKKESFKAQKNKSIRIDPSLLSSAAPNLVMDKNHPCSSYLSDGEEPAP